jgi:hypothetical protein
VVTVHVDDRAAHPRSRETQDGSRSVYTDEQDPSEVLASLWFRWTYDDGTTVPLSDGWRTRIRAVMVAGSLPPEIAVTRPDVAI